MIPIKSIVSTVKEHFLHAFQKQHAGYMFLDRHVYEVERWALQILESNPQAEQEVVLVSVWLHDYGQLVGDITIDHAVKSEQEARKLLNSFNVEPQIIEQVAHCVRSHRNRDLRPQTLEAKILAASDSASHMTDINYIVHLSDGMKEYVEGKIERDYRDLAYFPTIQEQITPLYKAWKELIKVFPVRNLTENAKYFA